MASPQVDALALAQSGFEALRGREWRRARECFERIVLARQADAGTWVALARACRGMGDGGSAIAALDRALALDPRNTWALIQKADYLADAGDARAASAFYQFAVETAPPAERLPAELRADLARAQTMCDRYAAQFESFLRGRLAGSGQDAAKASPRFAQSLDILLGRKTIYFQQPQTYFFPELPQIQFYDRGAFPWFDGLEAATADIRAEAEAVLRDDAAFAPYLQSDPKRPRKEASAMTDNPNWGAFYLWKDGQLVAGNAARCPRTMAALEHVPLAQVPQRSPSVLFSLLRPRTRIPPHTGLVNTRLICHLPLIVPPGCGLRVGNDSRTPVAGKGWAFDDTIEHEAWNDSDEPRVILLFEIWKPELGTDERRLVCSMFEAIDDYRGQKPAWGI